MSLSIERSFTGRWQMDSGVQRRQSNRKLQTLAAAALLALPAVGFAQSASWTSPSSGVWSGTTNWTPNTPPNAGGVATFNLATAGTTVTLDTAVTLGGLNILTDNYTLAAGAGSITLNAGASVNVGTGNTGTIGSALRIATSTLSSNFSKDGSGTLVLNGSNNIGGNIQINAGAVRIDAASALNGVSTVAANGGVLLLNNIGATPTAFLGLGVSGGPGGAVESIAGNNTWNGLWLLINQASVGVDSGTLTLNGGVFDGNQPGFNGLTKVGAGTFRVDNVRLIGPLTINGGTVQVKPDGTPNGVSKLTGPTGGLTIAGGATPTATLDLTDNDLVLDYTSTSPISTVRAQIRNAYNGGLWNQPGISTSLGGAIISGPPNVIGKTAALGYAEASALGNPSTFNGQSVDSTTVIVKYTLAGDSDLDGDADGVDIGNWATNFTGELGGTGSQVWSQGDWDYDGDVDGVDAGIWAQNFTGELGGGGLGSIVITQPIAPGAAAILEGMGITVVPEPVSASVLMIGGLGLLARRRKNFSDRRRINN
ncbi:MAG TPA: autotransporter-associated beta strand repeat-containing protein [Tepidisphaeraceae bacterium]|jgi:autotransporter-associated beta strand protein